jgi:hypothetical protein
MIKGAVPGTKGGWVMVRDAVKRPRRRMHRCRRRQEDPRRSAPQRLAPAAEAGEQG